MQFPALNAAHIQHIVDQVQQMVPGCPDLFQIALDLILIANTCYRQIGKSDNRIHWRTYIMGHIRKECALSVIRLVCLREGIFQKPLLFHLSAYLFIHAAESQHNSPVSIPFSCPDSLQLIILCLPILAGTVIYIILVPLSQLFLQFFFTYTFQEHLPVFLIDIIFYVKFQAFF